MAEPIPTNAVLKDMDDAALKALADQHGVTDTDREDITKALKLIRNAAKSGGAPKDDTQEDEDQNEGGAQGTAPQVDPMTTEGAAMDEANQDDNEPDQHAQRHPFEFELGATVYLFERNHDPVTSEPLDGYQEPKTGKIVKLSEDSSRIDVQTGGEDSPALTSHDVPHRSQAGEGENFWADNLDPH